MEFRKMVTITLYTRQQKKHWYIEQFFGLCGRGRGWDYLGEWHWNTYSIIYEMSRQSRFDAGCWMLGAGALGRPRGMVWGGRREEGSGWGTHVYLWWINFGIWQNQYNIVKFKSKIKLKCFKKKKKKTWTLDTHPCPSLPLPNLHHLVTQYKTWVSSLSHTLNSNSSPGPVDSAPKMDPQFNYSHHPHPTISGQATIAHFYSYSRVLIYLQTCPFPLNYSYTLQRNLLETKIW